MRKIILYIATSLDGFIAREDGNIDWLTGFSSPEGEDYGYKDFLAGIDTTLLGYNTYQQTLTFEGGFPYPEHRNYVFSRSNHEETSFVRFVKKDISAFISELKAEAGKNIWLIGGGALNGYFMKNGLIDSIILSIIPVILGSGIKLFGEYEGTVPLTDISTRQYPNGVVQIEGGLCYTSQL
jgi:dihydrofolate reductase